ncbi:MAG: hypothetical protein ACUVTD_05730 [Nitrososphaerales archaeon]
MDEADKKLSMLDSKAMNFEDRIGFLERESIKKKDIKFCEDCQRMMPADLFLKHKKEHDGGSFIGFIVGFGLLLFGLWLLGRLLPSQNQTQKSSMDEYVKAKYGI